MRNYRKEYDNYQSTPEQKKNRAGRNKSRRALTRARKLGKETVRTLTIKTEIPVTVQEVI